MNSFKDKLIDKLTACGEKAPDFIEISGNEWIEIKRDTYPLYGNGFFDFKSISIMMSMRVKDGEVFKKLDKIIRDIEFKNELNKFIDDE